MFLSTRLFIRWVLLWPNLTGARHKGINANFQVPFHPLGRSGRGWSVLFFHHIAVDTTWVGHANPPAHPHTGVREREGSIVRPSNKTKFQISTQGQSLTIFCHNTSFLHELYCTIIVVFTTTHKQSKGVLPTRWIL